ncbi:MAG: TonB-dependent receptor [Candidatus Zixiibacteriota bacterium]|nr:MAG: TonB-dependent receptor [candidate division Zixibacteria bacterium]
MISSLSRAGLAALCFLILSGRGAAQESPPTGSLQGIVIDAATQAPLMGANLVLAGTERGAVSDEQGRFTVEAVPVGSYRVQASYLGYETVMLTDVIVRPQRITTVQVELWPSPLEMAEVTVQAPRYFPPPEEAPVGLVDLSAEEIRRSPGTAGDVSRIMMSLPSVAKVNDTRSALIVRGGSPLENGYLIDNIPVPNIHHFPAQGASGGALGLVNVDFVRELQFHSGGFSALHGDRLSSITDLSLRAGNRAELDGQADLNMIGAGIAGEGPLGAGKGSWMASVRRSYLDLVVDSYDIEASTIPEYGDFQAKVEYDLSDRHRITALDLLGVDRSVIEKERSVDQRENVYGQADWTANTGGVNWRWLWKGGYSNTSLSHTYTRWDNLWRETRTDSLLTRKLSTEQEVTLRQVNRWAAGRGRALEFGVEARRVLADYDNLWGASTDPLGQPTPEVQVSENVSSAKLAAFAQYRFPLPGRVSLTLGLRADYFEYSGNGHAAPRAQLAWQATPATTLTAAFGQFYQFLPLVLLSQQEAFRELDDPRADHYVVGLSHLLTENTRLTVEAYDKEYHAMPLDPATPSLFVMDQSGDLNGFSGHEQLVSDGRARTRGVELMLQKKLAQSLYGVVSGSVFRARYRGYDGVWRDRIYDNRWMVTVEGGYQPNARWEFSLRWVYAGGVPYTPFDLDASRAAQRGVLDETRVNSQRLPDYHTLDLRVDRRFAFSASNLVLYLGVWNVYNRENVAEYVWNQLDNEPDTMNQWGILPVFGMEFEF